MPKTEKNGRVHTSTITVSVLDSEPTYSGPYTKRSPDDFEIVWFSGTGSGGQHRNKHQNSARIRHIPTGIIRTAQTRSRENSSQNAMDAIIIELDRQQQLSTRQSVNSLRKAHVGSGERSDKRRTYRFRDDRVVDHLTGKSASCSDIMHGKFNLLW